MHTSLRAEITHKLSRAWCDASELTRELWLCSRYAGQLKKPAFQHADHLIRHE
jgi:hypothetical protein